MSRLAYMLVAGITAGVLDIVFAWAFWALRAQVPWQRILQSVAAGLLGKASFTGGGATAALGLALHLAMTVAMSAAYFESARRWPILGQWPWTCGALYGLTLYVVMRYVVVPLSAAMPPSRDPWWVALSIAAHVALVAWPIAWFASRAPASA